MIQLFKQASKALCAVSLAMIVSACTSTEVIDNFPQQEKKGKTITLSVSAPDGPSTRAGSDHQLRYVAKLISGNGELKDRKEALATEGDKATITFSVEEGKYTIILFADYIPSDQATVDENGRYTDYYYKTVNYKDNIEFPQNISVKKMELNNDNLDCFAGMIKVNKGPEEIEENITLKRIVSKICFFSKTCLSENQTVENISYSKIPYYSGIDLSSVESDTGIETPNSFSTSATTQPLKISTSEDEMSELFYYYTFANKSGSVLGEMAFTINFNDDSSKKINIQQGIIPAVRNSIISVQGAFFSPVPPKLGDIILNLSTPDGWGGTDSKEVDVDW